MRFNKICIMVILCGMLFLMTILPASALFIPQTDILSGSSSFKTDSNGVMFSTSPIDIRISEETAVLQAGAEIEAAQGGIEVSNGVITLNSGNQITIANGIQTGSLSTSAEPSEQIQPTSSQEEDVELKNLELQSQINMINLVINGQTLHPDVPPVMINDRTMVPLRIIAENLGLSVNFDSDKQIVTATMGNTTVSLVINGKAYKNGQEIPIDVPAMIQDGRTLVPVRFISEAFSADVAWEPTTSTVSINTSSAELFLTKGMDYADAKNYTEAFSYFKKSADLGNVSAQLIVGYAYYDGKGISQDYEAGRTYFLKAANQGNDEAQLMMALTYYNPIGALEDVPQAVEWFKKSSAQGNADAQAFLGEMYIRGKDIAQDYQKALELLTMSVQKGNARAEASLGRMYYFGWGVKKDIDKSFNLFKQSAQEGDPIGQIMLAGRYLLGEGVSKDATEAVKWYSKSANQGNAEAQYYVGMAYLTGIGISKDLTQAKYWFQQSANQGFQPSQEQLDKIK